MRQVAQLWVRTTMWEFEGQCAVQSFNTVKGHCRKFLLKKESCAAPWGTCNLRVSAVSNLCSLATATTRHSNRWRMVEIRWLHFPVFTLKRGVMKKIWSIAPLVTNFRTTIKSWTFGGSKENRTLLLRWLKTVSTCFFVFFFPLGDKMFQLFGDFIFSSMFGYISFQQMAAKAVFKYVTDCKF